MRRTESNMGALESFSSALRRKEPVPAPPGSWEYPENCYLFRHLWIPTHLQAARRQARRDNTGAFDASTVEAHPLPAALRLLQLRDATAAEDAVQENCSRPSRAAPVSRSLVGQDWLTGSSSTRSSITLRRQARERRHDSATAARRKRTDLGDAHFSEDGHWTDFPDDWPAPTKASRTRSSGGVFETWFR